jgi:peptide/nickel transport system ATP-binding protein/oligopeptide transport system ATP-binding protein
MTANTPVLEVTDLKKHFPVKKGLLRRTVGQVYAVDGVSFTINEGETLGLVGESGCGKTTAGRAVLRLIEPTSGSVKVEGREITGLSKMEMRPYRREMQIVFQDPFSSLNPRMTAGDIVGEPLQVHGVTGRKDRRERVVALFERVGLRPAQMANYPHQFSGGQRQRIGIARALALGPKLIVGDEPVSALDVSIQAQVINLMRSLQQRFGLSYIFISHDLAVVKHIADRIAVMYLGKIVETATTDELFRRPRHPYTRALLSAVPLPDPTAVRERALLEGDIPSAMNPPPGCRFHTRCRFARESCRRDEPELPDDGSGHATACPWWPEFPPPPAIVETTGQDQDRLRLDRLQAAFVSQTEAT